ncbi:MAG: hypothetical protein LBP67_07770 [Bacteroidales bacterium]|nr:hypothetical protein [Bacteroidales bacterium]
MASHKTFSRIYIILFISFISNIVNAQEINVPNLNDTCIINSLDRNQTLLNKIYHLDNSLDSHIFNGNNTKAKTYVPISDYINIKQLYIAAGSILVALIGAILTFFAFWVQTSYNKKTRTEANRERFESRFFLFINMYNELVNEIEIINVCKGHQSFNFLFYEIQALFYIIKDLNIQSIDGSTLTKDEIMSISVSITISGITPNNYRDNIDLIYSMYKDIILKEDYVNICNQIKKYVNIDNDDLEVLYKEERFTLFWNYAYIQLKEKKQVYWFIGRRSYLIPYFKLIRSKFMYIDKYLEGQKKLNLNINDEKNYYLQLSNSSMSEHELAVLYMIVNSRENHYMKIKREYIDYLVESTELPDLYNYKKWGKNLNPKVK